MKTQSKEPIQAIQPIGGGKFYFHFNIQEVNTEENGLMYEADTVTVSDTQYGSLVEAVIREKYTVSNELAMINNRIAMPDDADKMAEFEAYQQWRVMAKAAASKSISQNI